MKRGVGPLPAPGHSLGPVSSSSPGHGAAPASSRSPSLTFQHPPVLGSWREERRQPVSTEEGLQGPQRPLPTSLVVPLASRLLSTYTPHQPHEISLSHLCKVFPASLISSQPPPGRPCSVTGRPSPGSDIRRDGGGVSCPLE